MTRKIVANLCRLFLFNHLECAVAGHICEHDDGVELHTGRFVYTDVLAGIGQQACRAVDAENLNGIVVSACAEQESSVGRDIEVAWMDARRLVAYFRQHTGGLISSENGDAVVL